MQEELLVTAMVRREGREEKKEKERGRKEEKQKIKSREIEERKGRKGVGCGFRVTVPTT